MKTDRFRYITPEIITAGRFSPGSAEAFEEAEEYNKLAAEGHQKLGRYRLLTEMYKVMNIIAFIVGILCLPACFSSILEPIAGMAALLVSAAGSLFIGVRYFYQTPFSFKWNEPLFSTVGLFGKRLNIVGELQTIPVIIGGFLIPVTLCINRMVSVAAAAVYLAVMIIYTFKEEKHRVPLSAVFAALPVLINVFTLPYAVLMVICAVYEEKQRRIIVGEDLYPEFKVIEIVMEPGGIKKRDIYEKADKADEQSSEMESL